MFFLASLSDPGMLIWKMVMILVNQVRLSNYADDC